MTDVQAIFNKVIASGRYSESGTRFMCTALTLCLRQCLLPHEEVMLAKNEIDQYIGDYQTLGRVLEDSGLPFMFKDRLAIYKDWANRPKLLKESPDE